MCQAWAWTWGARGITISPHGEEAVSNTGAGGCMPISLGETSVAGLVLRGPFGAPQDEAGETAQDAYPSSRIVSRWVINRALCWPLR